MYRVSTASCPHMACIRQERIIWSGNHEHRQSQFDNMYIYIYIWSPPPPGPTFSHPRRGRCHRDIYNKIVHSTETMEKTVKNEHLSKWKLICTESKNCCKSVLFRPKFGLESHGLRYIWYPPKQKPTSLHVLLVFAPVVWLCHKKKLKNLEKTKKPKKRLLQKQKSKNQKKPWENQKKPKKSKKPIFQDSCKSKNAKIQKTSRKPKKPKKTIFQKSGDRVNRQESWNIGFFDSFWFFWFSRGFLDFCIFTFARVLEYCFFCFFCFFGFLEVFWIFAFARVLEYCVFFCILVFSRFFKLFFVFFKLFGARNLGQGLVPSEALKWIAFGMT